MKIIDFFTGKKEKELQKEVDSLKEETHKMGAFINEFGDRVWGGWAYDGEKNLAEVGPAKKYWLDYPVLRVRAWQSYLESEITQTGIRKFAKWAIGSGLKLQAEPNTEALEMMGINVSDSANFSKKVEALFSVFCNSKRADYSGMKNLNQLAKTAYITAKNSGDALVVLRLINNHVAVQIVDGCHITNPDWYSTSQVLSNGNVIYNGIEYSKTKEHVAYYVVSYETNGNKKVERIEAKNRFGITQAFLVNSGLEIRIDDDRNVPAITSVIETLKKIERYKEASVGSAEEQAKVPYYIKHGTASNGENPLVGALAKASGYGDTDQIAKDINGKQLADNIAATTNKNVFNMPVDSELKAVDVKQQQYFKEFYTVNEDVSYSALNIPPDVARSKYERSFSASRAALMDWQHTLNVERNDFSFYKRVYEYWFYIQVLQNKINAPGFTLGPSDINDAYLQCRFIGVGVPHIDPEKEARAMRVLLGDTANNLPLTTVEDAVEKLNGADSKQNFQKYAKEWQDFNSLGVTSSDDQENFDNDD